MTVRLNNLYKVQKKDILEASAVLSDAFKHDPLWNKIFEGESNIKEKFCTFFETPIRYCLKYGEVYSTSEDLEGIIAWVPGDLSDMKLWRIIRSGTFMTGMKMARFGKKMKSAFKQIQDDRKKNMKGRKYIYLQVLGVATKFQGQGFGGKLINALTEKSRRDGIAIYLETETEDNVKMYERFGFKLIKKINLPGIDLPMWEMIKDG